MSEHLLDYQIAKMRIALFRSWCAHADKFSRQLFREHSVEQQCVIAANLEIARPRALWMHELNG